MDINWTPRSVGPLFGLLSDNQPTSPLPNERIRLNSSNIGILSSSSFSSRGEDRRHAVPSRSPFQQQLSIQEPPMTAHIAPKVSPTRGSTSQRREIDHISPRNIQEIAYRKLVEEQLQQQQNVVNNNTVYQPEEEQLKPQLDLSSLQPSSTIVSPLKSSFSSSSINTPGSNNRHRQSPRNTNGSPRISSSVHRSPSPRSSISPRSTSSAQNKLSRSSSSKKRSPKNIPPTIASPSASSLARSLQTFTTNTNLSPRHNYISATTTNHTHLPNQIVELEPIPIAEDLGLEVTLQGHLSAGTINPDFVGAYGYFASYDELPIPKGPNGTIRSNIPKDSFMISHSKVENSIFHEGTLRGSHSARLELHANGIFRARLTHQAAGPAADERSINIDAVGKWIYLSGSSKMVLVPADRTLRIEIRPLPGSPTDNEIIAEQQNKQKDDIDDGPPGGTKVNLSDAKTGLLLAIHKGGINHVHALPDTREWVSLQYPVFRVPT